MQLKYDVPHHLSKLHDELLAAVPAVQPVTREDGSREAVLRISGDGETVMLDVPDDLAQADITAISTVVSQHDPTSPPAPPNPDEELAAAIDAATSLSELKDALLGRTRKGRAAGRRVNGGT